MLYGCWNRPVYVYLWPLPVCIYVIVSIKRLSIPGGTSIIVCADLWVKVLHRQLGMSIVVRSGNLCGVMVAYWPGIPEIFVRFPLYSLDSHFRLTHDAINITHQTSYRQVSILYVGEVWSHITRVWQEVAVRMQTVHRLVSHISTRWQHHNTPLPVGTWKMNTDVSVWCMDMCR